jgi:hypothetical protein
MPPEIAEFMTEILAGTSILVVLAICGSTVLTLAFTVGITLLVLRVVRKAINPDPGILQNGIPAQATILNVRQTGVLVNHQPQVVRQTGVLVNHQPQVAFDLEVHPPGDAPYQARAKAVIPMVNIPQFQPGAQVSVKIHPTDPTKVVLDTGGLMRV